MIKSLSLWLARAKPQPSLGSTLLLLVVAFLVMYPLAMVVYSSFNSGSPARPGELTLKGYLTIFGSLKSLNAFVTTIWLAATKTVVSVGVAVFLAWVVARTDTPFKGLLRFMTVFRFFLPYLPFILAWMLLLSPKSGIINVFLVNVFHLDQPLFDIFSFAGIVWVSMFAGVPVWFLMILPSFTNIDASFEESSRMSGAGNFTTFRRVTLPLIAPALLGASMLSFIHSLESFDVEAMLGIPAQIYVFTTRIYSYIQVDSPPNYPPAMAFSVLMLVLTAVLVWYQWRWFGSKQYKYATVTGRGFASRPIKLRRWKYLTFSLVLLYFLLGTVLPGILVLLSPFMKVAGLFIGDWFTLDHWRVILSDPHSFEYFWNTFLLAIFSATTGVFLYALMSYVIVRTRYTGRALLELMSWIPYTLPGIVLALGLLWVYVGSIQLPFAMYGTVQLLALSCIIKRMPVGVRTMNGVTIQISKELEEASRVHGASWSYTFRRIMLPLLWPGLVATWMLMAVFAVKELVIVLMLYGPSSKTLSVGIWQLSTAGLGQESQAMILGILEMVLIVILWLASQLIGRRAGGDTAAAL